MKVDTDVISEIFMAALMKLGYSLFIIIICLISIKAVSKLTNTLLNTKFSLIPNSDVKKAKTLAAVIDSIVRYGIIFVGLCSILIHFGVPAQTLTAVLGTGTVAIGLGAQSIIKDTLAGFLIILENQFSVGDLITVEEVTGFVEDITIRITKIRGFDGTLHIIPNGNLTMISNMTKSYINATVDIILPHNEDLDKVIKILNEEMDIAQNEIKSLKQRPTVLGVMSLSEIGATIRIVGECVVKEGGMAERALRLRIKKRFDYEGISLAVPSREIHIKEKN